MGKIRLDGNTEVVRASGSVSGIGCFAQFGSGAAARGWLGSFSGNDRAIHKFRCLVAPFEPFAFRFTDHEVLDSIAWHLAHGRLLLQHDDPDDLIMGTKLLGPAVADSTVSTDESVALTLDSAIEALKLNQKAKNAAYALKKKFPDVIFTSGRRNKDEQARAMASNVALKRRWIENTYAPSLASRACQKWVDDNPEKKASKEIGVGLKGVLDSLTDPQLSLLSKHLSGDAFDVQPVDKDAELIKAMLRKLAGTRNFLEKEGGLIRWHAQF